MNTQHPLLPQTDQRIFLTDGDPAYYMINCAHPDHFSRALG